MAHSCPILILQDGRILWGNPAALRFYGYALDELTAIPEVQVRTVNTSLIPAGHDSVETIERHRLGNDRLAAVHINASYVRFHSKEPPCVLAFIHDYQAQLHQEAHLQKLERNKVVLAGLHQLIFEQINEQDLWDRACEWLAEKSPFQRVWIAALGHVQPHTLDVLAYYEIGVPDSKDYMAPTRLSGAQLPFFQALDEGKTVTFMCKRNQGPFLAEADSGLLNNPEEQMIAAPICFHNQQWGVIVAASPLSDAPLTSDDVALFNDCSMGISVGFSSLHDRHSRQDTLRRYYDLYRLFTLSLVSSESLCFTKGLDGRYMLVLNAEPILGYSNEEVAGKTTTELFGKAFGDLSAKFEKQIFKTGIAHQGEFSLPTKHGVRRQLWVSENLFRNERGDVIGFCGVVRNVTSQKEVETQLRANEERLRSLRKLSDREFSSEQDFICFAMGELMRLTSAPRACFNLVEDDYILPQIFSYDRLSGLTKPVVPLSPKVANRFSEQSTDSAQLILDNDLTNTCVSEIFGVSTMAFNHHACVRIHDDENKLVAICGVLGREAPYSDADVRQIRLFVNNMWNILQRRQKTQGMAVMQTAIDQSVNIVVLLDHTRTIIYLNDAFERTLGYKASDFMGLSVHTAFVRERVENADGVNTLRQALQNGHSWSGELIFSRPGGDKVLTTASLAPLRDTNGNVSHFIVQLHDITEATRLRMQLVQSQKLETLGKLSSGIAHDFNNLLQVINGCSEILLTGIKPGDHSYKELYEIFKAGMLAKDLTSQLLSFGRGAPNRQVKLLINALVRDLEILLKRLFPKRIAFKAELSELPEIYGDITQINQVIMNLCINARDAISNAGSVTLTTELRTVPAQKAESFGMTAGAEAVVISVMDNGCGMPPEIAYHIFEPFFSTKKKGQGTGLGLSTVYGVVKAHSGHIEVDSTVGVGTTFRVWLPVTTPQDIAMADHQSPDGPPLPEKHF